LLVDLETMCSFVERESSMATPSVLQREDVPQSATWNHESLFAGWAEWENEYEAVSEELPSLSDFEGTLTDSPERLLEWFAAHEDLIKRLYHLSLYASTSFDVDTQDSEAQAKNGQVGALWGQQSALSAFAVPEMQNNLDTILKWVAEDERLANCAHYFDNLQRIKQHTRSAEVEEVLGMLSDPFSNIWSTAGMLADSDLKFKPAVDSAGVNHPVIQSSMPTKDDDREKRRTTWQSFSDGYVRFINTFASNYITSVKQAVFQARVRNHESVLHSRLAPYNVPVEVFHTLMETFAANLSVWHRYWDVKAKAIGVDRLRPWDIWAPNTPNPPQVTFEQSVDWICDGMNPLGEGYVSVMRRGCLEDRWVDYAPNEAKGQGAHSSYAIECMPFIVMSFDGRLEGMSTLAHELGHSMHAYYTDKHQPLIYNADISMTVAETASNFNQAMTRAYLMEQGPQDRDFQLALVQEAMTNFHRYFFIMPTLARFEMEVFERAEAGKPLNADILNGIMRELYAEGYGDTLEDDPERTGTTWAQFLHLYAPFYTFQYAIGISAANALSADILSGQSPEKYLGFLQAGSSKYPMELFEMVGVDMSTPEPIVKAFAVMEGIIDHFETLVS
jgi:oligoendopeptidase F